MQKSTTRLVTALGLFAGIATMPGNGFSSPADRAYDFDPLADYGDSLVFDVLRYGKPVGSHIVTFKNDGRELLVTSRMQMSVDILFIPVYQLNYLSVGRWRNGQMAGIAVNVDDNGTLFSLVAVSRTDDGKLLIKAGETAYTISRPLFPTNHWNPAVLNQTRVLNTLTGRMNDVKIVYKGREPVVTEHGPVSASHFAYTGDLVNDVWYDDAGRWVKMRFKGTDGSSIEYRCRRCQGNTAIGAATTR